MIEPMADFSSFSKSQNLQDHLLRFCRKLRAEGIKVTIANEIDAYRALRYIDIFNRADFYNTLKCNLITRHSHIPIFAKIFVSHWGIPEDEAPEDLAVIETKSASEISPEKSPESPDETRSEEQMLDNRQNDTDREPETIDLSLYSQVEVLREKDFSSYTDDELEEVQRIVWMIAKKLAFQQSRKKVAESNSHYLDLRRTLRKNIRYGGKPIQLAWKGPKITKTRVVALCDVSGSMEQYSRFLVLFLYGLQRSLSSVETFVFSTRLSRITRVMRRKSFQKALGMFSETVPDWSGGTDTGACLREFNRKYAPTLLYRKAVVLIISDGFDRGDQELLERQMERLKSKARRLIWLNPLLGSPSYQPLTKGMMTALPFLDQFMPLHNLESLINLARALYAIR